MLVILKLVINSSSTAVEQQKPS